jgi:hypothetical protein
MTVNVFPPNNWVLRVTRAGRAPITLNVSAPSRVPRTHGELAGLSANDHPQYALAADVATAFDGVNLAFADVGAAIDVVNQEIEDLEESIEVVAEDAASRVKPAYSVRALYTCLAATTGPITLSGHQIIDGVQTTTEGAPILRIIPQQIILVKDQVDPAQNGPYFPATGAWVRVSSTLVGTQPLILGAAWGVRSGTVNAGTGWLQTNATVIVGVGPVYEMLPMDRPINGVFFPQCVSVTGTVTDVSAGLGIFDSPNRYFATFSFEFDASQSAAANNMAARFRLPPFIGGGALNVNNVQGVVKALGTTHNTEFIAGLADAAGDGDLLNVRWIKTGSGGTSTLKVTGQVFIGAGAVTVVPD